MERGRTDYLRLLGVEQSALFAEARSEAPNFAFVVRSMKIDFLKPAKMDDVVEVRTAPREVSGASIALQQRVTRGEEILVEAEVRVAFIAGGKAQRIPKALREAMRAD
jgi:acyl-CoA thioester hydrolase